MEATTQAIVGNAVTVKSSLSVPTSLSQLFERIWKYSFFVITIVFAVLIERIFKYRKNAPVDSLRGNAYNLLFSLPLLAGFHFSK